jgi:spore coat polysaccharide biosynthesis predicted glycosyltransferase SpsG
MKGYSVLVRCDGSAAIGLGHVVRCLSIARELRDTQGCTVAFAMRFGPVGRDLVSEHGFPVLAPVTEEGEFSCVSWLAGLVREFGADVLIIDARDDLDLEGVKEIKQSGVLVASIDDLGDRRLGADLAFYPPIPQLHSLDWTGFLGELHAGWQWVPLRSEFRGLERQPEEPLPRLLVTMGGSDPAGFTLQALRALQLSRLDFALTVIIGPAFSGREELADLLAASGREFQLLQAPASMARVMTGCDLALASFGVTAYELAAAGVPAIYLCLTPDHAESASAFVAAGIARSLGFREEICGTMLAGHVEELLADRAGCRSMGERARGLVDGRGAARIAECIIRKRSEDACH